VTADQMREVDRAMVEDLGISLIQMMENAGRSLARLAAVRFAPQRVTVLTGPGGNGGGGIAAARHLANHGAVVTITPGRPLERFTETTAAQAAIAGRMGITIGDEPPSADLVIDALVGYSLRGDPRGRTAELVRWANRTPSPVLALDVPTGLDATDGTAGDPCVGANATLTIALPKTGLSVRPDLTGEVYLADISVPPDVYRRFGIDAGDVFGGSWLIRLG
jgi:NAD(P)H-hydrate epimerase